MQYFVTIIAKIFSVSSLTLFLWRLYGEDRKKRKREETRVERKKTEENRDVVDNTGIDEEKNGH